MKCLLPSLALLLLAGLPARASAQSGDPAAAFGKLPPLAGTRWQVDERWKPIVLVMPPGLDGAKGFPARCATWAGVLARLFERDVGGDGQGRLVIGILPDDATLAACRAATGVLDARDEQAFYAPSLGAVLIVGRLLHDEAAIAAAMRPLLHAVTHALVAVHAPRGAAPPLWLEEGLAERWSANTGFEPATTAALKARDDAALAALLADFQNPARRASCVLPLVELVALGSRADLDTRLARMTADKAAALRGIANEANLLLAWLEDPEGGAPKDLAARLQRELLAAKPGTPLLAPTDAAALEAPFLKWLQTSFKGRLPNEDARDFTFAAPASSGEVKAGVAARVEDLRPPADDPSLVHAQILRQAEAGDLRGALARLDALIAQPGALPEAEVAGLPVERRALAQLIDLRQRWLTSRVGKPLELPEGGKPVRYVLTALRDGKLLLEDPRKVASEKPESAFTPSLFAAQLQGSGLQASAADDEARALCWVLAADDAWKDKTAPLVQAETGPSGKAILARRPQIDGLKHLGFATDNLAALAARPLPLAGASEAERDGWLAAARTLFADIEVPVVAQRATPLRALTAQVLGARFDADPLKTLSIKGKIATPTATAVVGTWDFNTAPPFQDWISVPPDVSQPRKPAGSARPAGGKPSGVDDHWLVLRGEEQWRCQLGLRPPLLIEWELEFRYTHEESELARHGQAVAPQKATDHIELRVGGDGRGTNLAFRDFGMLRRNDRDPKRVVEQDTSLAAMQLEKTYKLKLEYDGSKAKAWVDGKLVATLETANLKGGFLEIWHDTDRPIAIRKIVAQGERDPATLVVTREAWIAAQVEEIAKGK